MVITLVFPEPASAKFKEANLHAQRPPAVRGSKRSKNLPFLPSVVLISTVATADQVPLASPLCLPLAVYLLGKLQLRGADFFVKRAVADKISI